MCESKLFVLEDNEERLLVEDVIYIASGVDTITIMTLAGDRKELKGYRVAKVDFMAHKVLLVK